MEIEVLNVTIIFRNRKKIIECLFLCELISQPVFPGFSRYVSHQLGITGEHMYVHLAVGM